MTDNKKSFGPLFWGAFAILIVFNLSAFYGYQEPLKQYSQFARVHHIVQIKAGGDFVDIERHGSPLPGCKVVNDGSLNWIKASEQIATYEFNPLVAASPGKSNENAICQAGDIVRVDFTDDNNANTALVLLSINFAEPLKGAK